jgi:hypothetical protein
MYHLERIDGQEEKPSLNFFAPVDDRMQPLNTYK